MRKILKAIIPNKLVVTVRALIKLPAVINYYPRDMYRYLKYSATLVPCKKLPNLEAKVIADSHIIEKGLSLSNPRLGFGKGVVERLLEELNLYKIRNYPTDTFACKFGISVLHKYIKFNTENGYDVSEFEESVNKLDVTDIEDFAGSRIYNKDNVLNEAKKNFQMLSENRFSLRQFTGESVDRKLLEKAIDIAKYAPSVCNRQSSRVYVVETPDLKNKVVDIQKGNRGFGDQIDKMLIVTSDICSFFGLQERNQSYVDGGLFAMSLLYGLAFYGIGACPLNWCAEKKRDVEIRKLLGIKDSENILMVIAIGNLPDGDFKVAKSPRKNIDDIIEYK